MSAAVCVLVIWLSIRGKIMTKAKLTTRLDPCTSDLENERALLGAMILEPLYVPDVARLVSRESFSGPLERNAFEAILRVYENVRPMVLPIKGVVREFRRRTGVSPNAGTEYMELLLKGPSHPGDAVSYALTLQKRAVWRGTQKEPHSVDAQ
jgi:replicative DNA helicase